MPTNCVIFKCTSLHGKDNGISFYRIPVLRTALKDPVLIKTTLERQAAWRKAINQNNFEELIAKKCRICSKHFISGKPAKLLDKLNADWTPSLDLGYKNSNSVNPQLKVQRYNRILRRNNKKQKENINENMDSQIQHNNDIQRENKMNTSQACQTEDFYLNECTTDYYDKKYELFKKKYEILQNKYKAATSQRENLKMENLKRNPKQLKYLTGFATYETMNIIFNHCEAFLPSSSYKMSKFDVFIMMFSKLRLDLPFTYIAYSYNISLKTISRLFYQCLEVVHRRLNCFIFWPDEEAHKQNTPNLFKQIFENKKVFILDCFEIFCERPGKRLVAASTFSHYKHHQTIKYLICISSFGSIAFVSKGYGGHCSNKFITEDCGILDFIKDDDIVMVDRGFLIEKLVKQKKAEMIMPSFKKGRNQLQPLEIEWNREIAALRIHVERVIGTLRSKFLVTNRQPITSISNKIDTYMYFDYMMKVACAVVNLNPSIV